VSEPRTPPAGVLLWLLVALPIVMQLAITTLGIALVGALVELPERMAFYSLPQAAVVLGAHVVFGAATLLVARRIGPVREMLAIRRTPLGPGIGLAVLGLAVGLGSAALLEPIFHGAESQNLDPGPFPGTTATAIAAVCSAISVVLGASVTEELYFRGLLYGRLDLRFARAAAVIGSAGAFGLAHFQPDAFPTLFALGLILGLLRMRTGSVWPAVGLHAANNGLAFVYLLAS
jgi:membrane protease YdiL (CAAX protease family)